MSIENVLNFFNTNTNEDIEKPLKSKLKPLSNKPIYKNSTVKKQEELEEIDKKLMDLRKENIKKSERLKAEITKGINEGINLDIILKNSIECIGLMTGDIVFIKQNITKINQLNK